MRRRLLQLALAALVLSTCIAAFPATASAQTCPPIPGGTPALAAIPARERLAFIQHRLRHDAHRARIWSYTWGSLYGTVVAVQMVASGFAETDEDRYGRYIAAGGTSVGVLTLLVSPLSVMSDQTTLDAIVPRAAPGPGDCGLLVTAEHFLERGAEGEAFGRSALVHVGSVVFNVGLGLALGLGLDKWVDAGISVGAGVIVSEVMIFTQPVGLIDDLARYRAGTIRPTTAAASPSVQWGLAPAVGPGRYGLRIDLAF